MPIRLPGVDNPALPDAFTAQASRGGRPFLFQITDVARQPLYPYLLAAHVNPSDFNEGHTKNKNVVMTYGGFVEFVWPDDLTTLTATSSTGGFLGPGTGLVSGSDNTGGSSAQPSLAAGGAGRHATMAWERQEDLLELFRNNGVISNGRGQPVLRGRVMVIYDRGIYFGHFTRFEVKETDEKAFSFDLSWDFSVEEVLYTFTGSTTRVVFPSTSRSTGVTRTPDQVASAESDFLSGTGDFSPNGGPIEQSAADDSGVNQALFPGVRG